jgi:hypothetical protein
VLRDVAQQSGRLSCSISGFCFGLIENFQIPAILGDFWGIDIRKKNKIKKTKNVYIIEVSLKTARCQKPLIRGKKVI